MRFFKSRVFIAAVCVLLAGVVAFGLLPMREQKLSATTYVITAGQNIAEGTIITESMLVSVEVGAYGLSSSIITSKDEIIGKVANTSFFKGEYIIPQRLATEDEYNSQHEDAAIKLAPNEMLIAIQLPSTASGLAGMLRTGDLVSIYELVAPSEEVGQSQARKVFESMKVYDVRNSALQSIDDLEKAQASAQEAGQSTTLDFNPTYVIFCCTENQAKEMVRLVSEGILYMTLEQPEVE